jgi:cytidyltransferase-like protein
MSDKIILVTGGFDPLHSGHIEYIKSARELGRVVVGVNSDAWLTRKKGQPFMPFEERINIINNLKDVMVAIGFNDFDGSAKDAIKKVREMFPNNTIVFANGGDRTKENIPEMDTDDTNIEFLFGVGGSNKMNSSSWILQEWKAPKTERQWGYYRVLHEVSGAKVKELTVEPGKSLSMQRHKNRSEYWIVSEGRCIVNSMLNNIESLSPVQLETHQEYHVATGEWHQLTNPFKEPCRIIEIQYGKECIEGDIERKI